MLTTVKLQGTNRTDNFHNDALFQEDLNNLWTWRKLYRMDFNLKKNDEDILKSATSRKCCNLPNFLSLYASVLLWDAKIFM